MTKDKATGQLSYEELRQAAKLLVEARQAASKREKAELLRQAPGQLPVDGSRVPPHEVSSGLPERLPQLVALRPGPRSPQGSTAGIEVGGKSSSGRTPTHGARCWSGRGPSIPAR